MTKSPKSIDGWTLLGRIAAYPDVFHACDTTAALSALLLLRSQLVQGVGSRQELAALAAVVGHAAMREVINNLAGYEALRIVENLGEGHALGDNRGAAAARRWLLTCLEAPDSAPPLVLDTALPPTRESETFVAPPAASRALRRHRAMGARRVRPSS
jgi:hypothetical protein